MIYFPTYNVSRGDAWEIVKHHLDDDSVSIYSKTIAIEVIANFETLNSISKDDLIRCLRWLFEHYDFPEG